MRIIVSVFLALGMLLVPVLGIPGALAAPGNGGVGTPAADFTLQDLEGNFHSLTNYRDKVVFFFVVGWG